MSKKKEIGNLNNKVFGCELDPTNRLELYEDKEKGQQAYYKGQKIKYMDYIQEVGNRVKRNNIGLFKGIQFDNNGNIIKQ
mgnify:CR=1 FL=1